MKPTRLVVGVPKRSAPAPRVVRPPTTGSNPPSALTGIRCYSVEDEARTTTHQWLIPSSVSTGDGILVFINSYIGGDVTAPAGYTQLETESNIEMRHKVYWRISDGTEVDTTWSTANDTEAVAVFGRIPANGQTLATPDIAKGITVVGSTFDPIAITPAGGAGTYHVISVIMYQKGNPVPNDGTALSTGYEFVVHCANSSDVLEPAIYVQQKPSTAIVTTEDPDAIAWNTSAGSRYPMAYTLAIRAEEGDPTVVGFPVTASDIDSESATDGQVLTADGAGGAAWEDPSGGDHGALTGLADDDHTQYVLADGTRALTGDLSMGSNKLTNVTDPTSAQDAATKAYVDANAGGGYYEIIVSGSNPPVAVTNEASDDFLYGLVP